MRIYSCLKWNSVNTALIFSAALVGHTHSSFIARRDSIAKPSNPLGLQINYRVAWLDEGNGLFGGNITITLPASSLNSKWSLKFIFSDLKTKINEYWGDWTLERYRSGWYVILPAANSTSLTDSYLFNGQFLPQRGAARASLANITIPNSYALVMSASPADGPGVPLVSPFDYTNMPIDSSVPSKPFGPYYRASLPLPKPSSPASDPSQYGDGTTIQTTPIGLYIYSVVFMIGFIVFGAGTIQRRIYRKQFREQIRLQQEQIKLVEEANKPF
ncbi:hypothetical protein K493DRAFT_341561 [Basidiobolus meristosporus CBS 931.73]|uniref:Uncharacterized protein n=1 Tax=Basidiobolus meristosporus CBS 931.73 TaxID=1314790 RepID=A0A1Y1XMG4_9FUNG|nr:hypothetical protein K493DRAFT_341561 [Basidiobolus meristosporus CBS 931.73]|eukprot:ORX86938.1 hypothetical protein K493DRAFT_341561 [Basidiobolus meristosporus CBS 931.73]